MFVPDQEDIQRLRDACERMTVAEMRPQLSEKILLDLEVALALINDEWKGSDPPGKFYGRVVSRKEMVRHGNGAIDFDLQIYCGLGRYISMAISSAPGYSDVLLLGVAVVIESMESADRRSVLVL